MIKSQLFENVMLQASSLRSYVYWKTAILLVLIINLLFLISPNLFSNIALLLMNQAISAPGLTFTERQIQLTQATTWTRLAGNSGIMLANQINIEWHALQDARRYLSTHDHFSKFEPGRQLLSNTTFENGAAGWIQYRSEWQETEVDFLEYSGKALAFNRRGSGHGSISQIVQLKTDACYYFQVVGAAHRYDETRTFWLYWERNENGRQEGYSLESGLGEQIWAQRKGVFCVPANGKGVEEVVLAPVNAYGDVTVYLRTARLYELQSLP